MKTISYKSTRRPAYVECRCGYDEVNGTIDTVESIVYITEKTTRERTYNRPIWAYPTNFFLQGSWKYVGKHKEIQIELNYKQGLSKRYLVKDMMEMKQLLEVLSLKGLI